MASFSDLSTGLKSPDDLCEVPQQRRLSLRTRLAFGFGTIAFGIKNNGFSTVLLLFYNQVAGLPADTVGLVIALALIFDSIADPVIGHFSDQTRSRWGRRHPYMYAAALPIGLFYMLLWAPPRGDQTVTLWYLVGVALLVRTMISFYEVPNTALGAELTSDYHERTVLTGYRELFGWIGAVSMQFLLFAVLLKPAPGFPVGQLNPAGYQTYGIVAGLTMTAAILISALGTHREIAALPKLGHPLPFTAAFANMRSALRSRAFVILLLSNLLASTNNGVTFAMSVYANTYIWEMQPGAIALFTLSLLVGVAMAFVIAPLAGRRLGKRTAAVVCVVSYLSLVTIPVMARVLGVFPANTSPLLLPILLTFVAIYAGFGIAGSILFGSMLSDVVEEDQARTGRRSEGVFFAGNFFILKCAGGLGIFLTGLIITAVGFPTGARPGAVPLDVLNHLALVYSGVTLILGGAGALVLWQYPISQQNHEARVAALAGDGGAGGPQAVNI
ncbi:MAG: MFS transporter [Sphingomonadales bacterium]|nr:MFS transporter [Sphingomonadales bacterium]